MDFNLSSQTGQFSSDERIVRQSSDRDDTGLMRYAVNTSLIVQAGSETIHGPLRSYEVALTPEVVAVLLSRMGITIEELVDIGTRYTNLLRSIVDYSKNPPSQSELEALGLVEPVVVSGV